MKMYFKIILACTFFALVSARLPRAAEVQLSETVNDPTLPYPVLRKISAEKGYEAVLIPTFPKTEVGFSLFNGIAYVVSTAVAVIQNAIGVLFEKLPALLFGSAMVLAVCKFTHICTKLTHLKDVWELKEELNSFVTPERLARAAEFLQEAVEKFSVMQNEL
ncbi:hypothetical protein EVAR_2894_1 [Eumeta japonica]|uniref:Uncharacterized protein n=1 Tax=Eumeta variegata TaxID=151549 RepID=A0A4C1T0W0_EUMVA|nr:hypothetical protein EVAR_2894_1 [Eumeta japonica]